MEPATMAAIAAGGAGLVGFKGNQQGKPLTITLNLQKTKQSSWPVERLKKKIICGNSQKD